MERLRNYYLLHNNPVQLSVEILLIIIALLLWILDSLWSRVRSFGHQTGVDGR
jgi:hypothetical protein